ncbi:MAG TPA: AAA family ATPase [Gemmatimonadaceae bacterium]|nr:AAA family ATPase [Gemmatimonadaceae bacterium]
MLWSNDGALQRLTRDLTAEARAGRLEPVCCRDEEIDRVIDILLRQSKNNPALVGPTGTGKTAIAEGLAQRIAAGAVPFALRSARLLALDHVSMLAGTMYRGQYEERMRSLVAAASADPDIILFVDELHNLIGQGTAMGAAMDAANMLKSALVRGDFRVIGATTDEEYEHWVCGDRALERRFQKVAVRELSTEQTLEILRARQERLERHHNVAIADDALLAAVRLTDLFVTDRVRPDRAIDALDEACAHRQASASYSRQTESLIAERRALLRTGVSEPAPREREPERTAMAEPGSTSEDPIERIAREGFAALERFGAELEAAFSGQGRAGQTVPRADTEPVSTQAPGVDAMPDTADTFVPRADVRTASGRLARIDWELRRRLVDEGLVVRGHDVARVVGIATGQHIEWRP